MQARWCWAYGVSATVHVSLLAWLASGPLWRSAATPGQPEVRVALTMAAQPAPPPVIEPVRIELMPDRPAEPSSRPDVRLAEAPPETPTTAPRVPSRAPTSSDVAAERSSTPAPTPAPKRTIAVPMAPAPAASLPASPGQFVPARPLNNPAPPYPARALANRWQGDTILRVAISAAGSVERVTLLRSSGHAILDDAALEAVRRWRFEPATRDGRPVAWTARLPVQFRLSR